MKTLVMGMRADFAMASLSGRGLLGTAQREISAMRFRTEVCRRVIYRRQDLLGSAQHSRVFPRPTIFEWTGVWRQDIFVVLIVTFDVIERS